MIFNLANLKDHHSENAIQTLVKMIDLLSWVLGQENKFFLISPDITGRQIDGLVELAEEHLKKGITMMDELSEKV